VAIVNIKKFFLRCVSQCDSPVLSVAPSANAYESLFKFQAGQGSSTAAVPQAMCTTCQRSFLGGK
jgi:hypothetical protein